MDVTVYLLTVSIIHLLLIPLTTYISTLLFIDNANTLHPSTNPTPASKPHPSYPFLHFHTATNKTQLTLRILDRQLFKNNKK